MMKKKIDVFKNHFLTRKFFWVFVVATTSFYISTLSFENNIFPVSVSKPQDQIDVIIWLVVGAIIITGFLFFIFRPDEEFKKQEIHKQPSWVFYLYWGVILFSFLNLISSYFLYENKYWWAWFFPAFAIISLYQINKQIKQKPDLAFQSFAAGAVGLNNDDLSFDKAAANAAQGLNQLNSYVNVVTLSGGPGFGKSSYARMILEKMSKEETLYTYISLTETNEAKDFSKLFSERWHNTLSERYPKMNITYYLPFMNSILRESGNGFLKELLNLLSTINPSLTNTKVLYYDKFYEPYYPSLSSSITEIFEGIPEIKEDKWIIMIDEIERAQLDEIHRVIEVMERFKNEGRCGLPTKIIFILCISEPEFKEYIDKYEDKDTRAHSLKTFFYEDPKSIDHKIFLPPVEPEIQRSFVINHINEIKTKENIDNIPDEISPNTIQPPSRTFLGDHKQALDYIAGILTKHSPRLISKVAITSMLFLESFRDNLGVKQPNIVRFSDILAIEFIKFYHPYLIDFFVQTIGYLVPYKNNAEAYFLRKNFEESNLDLIGWIEEVTEKKIPESQKEEVLDLIGLTMHYYFDFVRSEHEVKGKDLYYQTTSYPELMWDYLSLRHESIETDFRHYYELYLKHKQETEKDFLKNNVKDNQDLVNYARLLPKFSEPKTDLHIDLVEELSNRLLNKKIAPTPVSLGDTLFAEAIYQFVFQILAVTEKDNKSTEYPSKALEQVFECLKQILSSKEITIGAKYTILNSLANNERGSGSSIHQRLEGAFNKILEYYPSEMKNLIKNVFADAEKRYFRRDSEKIYDYEENFFFVLYQTWSGSKENEKEIEKIKRAAKRKLEKYPEVIKLYWSRYSFKREWENINDALEDDITLPDQLENKELYMPLETLISKTKLAQIEDDEEIKEKVIFWEKEMKNQKVKELTTLKEDPKTLKAVLLKRELLP